MEIAKSVFWPFFFMLRLPIYPHDHYMGNDDIYLGSQDSSIYIYI